MSRRIGITAHGAKLQHFKLHTTLADPDLAKQSASWRIEPNEYCNHNQ
jgi:hypothetical protein